MARRLTVAFAALLALAFPLAGCGGEEEELDVAEGEPIEADDVSYNVVISRFLNPDDTADGAYLDEQPPPPPEQEYFGVFMQVANEGEEETVLPDELTVTDTLENEYKPVETESPFALPLGTILSPGEEYPEVDSVAFDGPTGGSMILFLIEEASTENRPLELEIALPSGKTGVVELDI
ncbi:MAG: hypothetical protein ACR2G3_02525 [Solirubrobacterales bacterium]